MNGRPYRGRFAPSPTGPLHRGSLVAALGSFLAARAAGGQWLLRIEDVDRPRTVAGAADAILRSLEAHGLYWDGPIVRQSERTAAYEAALETLRRRGYVYPCSCTRRELREVSRPGVHGPVYPGFCRQGPRRRRPVHAWRVRVASGAVAFRDRRCGDVGQDLEREVGDFIVRRADGWFAYQLAVVVDDAWQGITEVVRGEDLLDNTPRQLYLQSLLDLPRPDYLHLPVVRNRRGEKLSKQTRAPALDDGRAQGNLLEALGFLGLDPPEGGGGVDDLLAWAVTAWSSLDWSGPRAGRPTGYPDSEGIPRSHP